MSQVPSQAVPQSFPAESKQARVLIVIAGGLRYPGGVTRCVEYLIDSWSTLPNQPDYRIVDPRGVGSVFWSPLYLLKALVIVCKEALSDRPMIVHANLCEYGSALRKLPIVWLARMLGAHAVIHLHGAEMKTMFDRLPNLLRQIFRQGMLRADRIVVLGRSWEDFLCRDVGVDRERIVIIPNAVPIPSSMRSVQPGTRCRLLFLGRLGERKGADRFIQALSSPQLAGLDYEAVMAGDGQLDLYRAMADALSLTGRVNFTGWLDRDTVANLMRTSDVLVLPSLNEGLPMAILEGMANGLAIVTTPVGAIADAIRDGDTGLLVPPGDTPLLASALGRVIRDPELRLRLGRNAREFAQTDFDVARYGERFVRLYAQVLGGRAAEPKTCRR